MAVNGIIDHVFSTCAAGWQQQPITVPLASTSVNIALWDVDGTSATGVHFDVDTDHDSHSYMYEDGVTVHGELMWSIGAVCT